LISDGQTVLEVGCERGHFLRKCLNQRRSSVVGLELNPSAVAEAQVDGLPVTSATLDQVANEGAAYDVVCHFQVLEHVSDPAKFLSECVSVLKPGGLLIISVPNSGGFLRLTPESIWNTPPHHVTRWTAPTLRYLPSLFPLSIVGLWYEPLVLCHLDGVINLYLDRIPDVRYVKGCSLFIARRIIRPMLVKTRLYRCFRGHSLLACYRKNK
jgi:SAM-dependent methyltransferase